MSRDNVHFLFFWFVRKRNTHMSLRASYQLCVPPRDYANAKPCISLATGAKCVLVTHATWVSHTRHTATTTDRSTWCIEDTATRTQRASSGVSYHVPPPIAAHGDPDKEKKTQKREEEGEKTYKPKTQQHKHITRCEVCCSARLNGTVQATYCNPRGKGCISRLALTPVIQHNNHHPPQQSSPTTKEEQFVRSRAHQHNM